MKAFVLGLNGVMCGICSLSIVSSQLRIPIVTVFIVGSMRYTVLVDFLAVPALFSNVEATLCVADAVSSQEPAVNATEGIEDLAYTAGSLGSENQKLPSSIDKPVGEAGLAAEKAAAGAFGANSSANATRALVCPTLVIPNEYAPDNEPPRTGKPISHYVHSPRSLEKPQKERVLILAANSGGSCSLQLGDYYTFLSLLDKLQYGNVHGYDVLLGLGNVDIDLRKTWNKVAWMQKVVLCQFSSTSHSLVDVVTPITL